MVLSYVALVSVADSSAGHLAGLAVLTVSMVCSRSLNRKQHSVHKYGHCEYIAGAACLYKGLGHAGMQRTACTAVDHTLFVAGLPHRRMRKYTFAGILEPYCRVYYVAV